MNGFSDPNPKNNNSDEKRASGSKKELSKKFETQGEAREFCFREAMNAISRGEKSYSVRANYDGGSVSFNFKAS